MNEVINNAEFSPTDQTEFCQEDTEHQLNKNKKWECTECEPYEPGSESDCEYEYDSEW